MGQHVMSSRGGAVSYGVQSSSFLNIQYSIVQYSTDSTIQCSTVQIIKVQCSTVQMVKVQSVLFLLCRCVKTFIIKTIHIKLNLGLL